VDRHAIRDADRHYCFDVTKLRSLLGFQATVPLESGLGREVQWFRSRMPMTEPEAARLARLSPWYANEQLDFDKKLVEFRYRAIHGWFAGRDCLELGAADGIMTRLLLSHFAAVTAIDGARDLLAQIPDSPKLTKLVALFEEYAPSQLFDTLIADHVLEHVEAPSALLKQAARWVREGGRVVVGVPNAWSFHRLAAVKMGLLARPDELNERDLAVGHRRVYSPPTLRHEIESCGLRVLTVSGVFFKPLSNRQINETWTHQMLEAFYQLGFDFPENAAEIYAVCEPAR
jgi:2-polyprenyl-3-methyl-5-hydroxy-6-metoxy-1,4-benzoquinol methylase